MPEREPAKAKKVVEGNGKATLTSSSSFKPLSIDDLIMALPPSQSPEAVMTLSLTDRAIASMPSQLAFLKNLRKLDLSQNGLVDVTPLAKLASLSQLKLAHNRLTGLAGLKGLTKLTVLDVSHNVVSSLEGLEFLPSLVALIAPDNKIIDATPVHKCTKLETVVLSRNPLRSDTLAALSSLAATLRKVSMSQCGIAELPPLDLPLVTELRLNGNSLANFAEGTALRSLKILDISNNKFETLFSMRPFSVFIQQLNLHGNPLAVDDNPPPGAAPNELSLPMKRIVHGMFKNIKLLDAKPFVAPTSQELRDDRRRRADGSQAVDAVETKAASEAEKPSASRIRPLQPSAPEPEDAVYAGEIPEVTKKSYVRAMKVHRSEAQSTAPLSTPAKTPLSTRSGGSTTAAPGAAEVVLKGAAALALLTAENDDMPKGW